MEEWRYIKEYNGAYAISNEGRVFSMKYGKPHFMKLTIGTNGYLRVMLTPKGIDKQKIHSIHRLLAEYFIPNPEGKEHVNHKDGNKLNNTLSNLEWVTREENRQHAWDNGLHPRKYKKIK